MTSTKMRVAVCAASIIAAAAFAGTATAKGCNGYVNQAVWGCAVWDNNNGPQFPHYARPAAPVNAGMVIRSSAAPTLPALAYKPATGPGSVAAGIVAQGGGNLANRPSAGIVAQGGGNIRH